MIWDLPCLGGKASRASSTKTRIETMKIGDFSVEMFPIKSKFHENKDWNVRCKSQCRKLSSTSRASSTKTRIETSILRFSRSPSSIHQEQVPRKQGLKPIWCVNGVNMSNHQEQVPRKQGLKHNEPSCCQGSIDHQEQVPRKQGLKLWNIILMKI